MHAGLAIDHEPADLVHRVERVLDQVVVRDLDPVGRLHVVDQLLRSERVDVAVVEQVDVGREVRVVGGDVELRPHELLDLRGDGGLRLGHGKGLSAGMADGEPS